MITLFQRSPRELCCASCEGIALRCRGNSAVKLENAKGMVVMWSPAYWPRFFGIGFVAVGTALFLHFLKQPPHLAATLVTAVRASPFIAGGLAMLLRSDAKTEFNLRRHQITLWRRSLFGAVRYAKIAPEEILSLGLVRYLGGLHSFVEITLKNGSRCRASSRITGDVGDCNRVLDRIRGAMELSRHDRNGHLQDLLGPRMRVQWQQV